LTRRTNSQVRWGKKRKFSSKNDKIKKKKSETSIFIHAAWESKARDMEKSGEGGELARTKPDFSKAREAQKRQYSRNPTVYLVSSCPCDEFEVSRRANTEKEVEPRERGVSTSS